MVLTACGDSTSSSATLPGTTSPPETTPAASGTSAPGSTEATTAPTTTVAVTAAPTTTLAIVDGEASIVVHEGQVDGPGRLEVKLGTFVSLSVESDVSDEIHVHGYDLLADVTGGGTAQIQFNADIPGIFEVELEDAGLELLELVVEP